jgi:hypothetical protein
MRNILVGGPGSSEQDSTTQSMYLFCKAYKIVLNSYEFLAPTLLVSELQVLFAHSKQQWENIQVGFHEGQVRFILTKKHANWGLYTPSGKQTITITHDIPSGFTVLEKFEDSDWKGVAFQQAEFEKKQIPFDMS